MLQGARTFYEQVHDRTYRELERGQVTTVARFPDDYVVIEQDALRDREQLWEYLTRSLVEYVMQKRERRRGRGRPARGPGWTLVGYYPDEPQLSAAQVLMRKARELGGTPSQRALGQELGISAITIWRIVVASGIGWPLPLN